jgi:hypothetical protein
MAKWLTACAVLVAWCLWIAPETFSADSLRQRLSDAKARTTSTARSIVDNFRDELGVASGVTAKTEPKRLATTQTTRRRQDPTQRSQTDPIGAAGPGTVADTAEPREEVATVTGRARPRLSKKVVCS